MEIFEYKDIKIVADSYSNSRAWGHTATLFVNNIDTRKAKIRYLNRTWERYRYQSVILRVLADEMNERAKLIIDQYKSHTGKTRVKQAIKDELIACDDYYKMLIEAHEYFSTEYRAWKD